jgi:uncharacterized membrane protein YcfT
LAAWSIALIAARSVLIISASLPLWTALAKSFRVSRKVRLVLTLRIFALLETFTRFLADLIIGITSYYTDNNPFCKELQNLIIDK